MKQFHVNRLLKLAEFLEGLKPTKSDAFDMKAWSYEDKDACKTASCACGWATTIPSFRRAGLTLGVYTQDDHGCNYELRYKDSTDFVAASNFFGLTGEETDHLFLGPSYKRKPGPKAVARRIRSLLRKKGCLQKQPTRLASRQRSR
jgi:hypothetical protein